MFTIYSEKSIFENIILFNNEHKHWYEILCQHADICLNMTDLELSQESVPGTPIFEFINSTGGKSPIPLKEYFDEIYENKRLMMEKPRSAFFLNINNDEALKLQESYGVIVQSIESINDNMIKGAFHKELPKDTIVESNDLEGWECLFDFQMPPSNSIVITDDWLFKNEELSVIVGERNVIWILDAMLPLKLDGVFHVLIISDDQGKNKNRCEELARNLRQSIIALRQYQILVEIVFTETIHKRKIFTNYMSITCDKGFAMFRVGDKKKVRDDNDFRYEMVFNRINPSEGDTVDKSDLVLLNLIKKKCKSVKDYINNNSEIPNRRIMGDCNYDNSILNRLINDL